MVNKTNEDKKPIMWDLSSLAVPRNGYGGRKLSIYVVGFLYSTTLIQNSNLIFMIKNKKWIMLAGVLSFIFGIVLMSYDNVGLGMTLMFTGIILFITSIILLVVGLLSKNKSFNKLNEKKSVEDKWIVMFLGIALTGGAIFIIKTFSGILGIILGMVGLVMFAQSIRTKEQVEKDKEYTLLTKKVAKSTNSGMAIMVIGVFVLVGVWVSNINSLPKSTVKSDSSIACAYAQIAVKAQLKSPSTADFPSCRENNLMREADGKITVTSYVDSQNSFGAVVRTPFQVMLHATSDTTVAVDNVVLSDR